jgi:hypothetical protein
MILREVILQTRQSLQAAVTSNWNLVESHPPAEQFQLAPDVELTLLDRDLAERVMDCCEAQGYGFPKPVRQSPQLYSFVRSASQSGNLWDWKPDQRLEMCVALSRLVHPTSFPLEYHVKVSLNADGELEELIPLVGAYRGAWIAERDRDWLTSNDCLELQKLIAALPLALPERISRALWYNEYAARTYFADVRWTMIATALEALIHTDRNGSTAQFVTRTTKMAIAVGLHAFNKDNALQFYDRRSSLAHGQGLGSLRSEDQLLYILGEDLLRAVLKTAVLDSQFATTFKDNNSIRQHWSP